MEDLKILTLSELKDSLKTVEKFIKSEEDFLDDAKDAFIRDDDVWIIHKLKLVKLRELTDTTTGIPLYNYDQLNQVKEEIEKLNILNKRRNNLIEEIRLRELGVEFFDHLGISKNKIKQHNIYYRKGTMKDFLYKYIKENKYSFILINEIKLNDKRKDDQRYTLYAITLGIPKEMNILNPETSINIEALFGGIACTSKELGKEILTVKPSPVKSYYDVNLLENLNNPEKRLIRNVEKEVEEHGYTLVVETGDNNLVNYLLFDPEEYFNYGINVEKELINICKEWNDEEFIRLYIELRSWERKPVNPGIANMITMFNEIAGKYELWYVKNKFESPTPESYIFDLRKDIYDYVSIILTEIKNIRALTEQKEELEKEFDTGIENFPDDLLSKLESIARHILLKNQSAENIEKKLWGVLGSQEEGLVYKHDRLVYEFKKIKLKDEGKFSELREKSDRNKQQELYDKIKDCLDKYKIIVDDFELNELSLEVLRNLISDEEQFYEEIITPELKEPNLNKEIEKVIKERFNNTEIEKNTGQIEFATPRKIRDERILELNDILFKLNVDRISYKTDKLNLESLDKQINSYTKEYNKLAQQLIGDVLLFEDIKAKVWAYIEDKKNEIGLSTLNEEEYYITKDHLSKNCAYKIFNLITNNEFEKNLTEQKLNDFIDEQIVKHIADLNIKRGIIEQMNENKKINEFKKLWVTIVNSNFKNDIIIQILDEVGYQKEKDFIEYMKSMFGRRTIDEWMKYYEQEDKIGQYITLENSNLPPEQELKNRQRIDNSQYAESTVGKYTFENLRKFEEKYIYKKAEANTIIETEIIDDNIVESQKSDQNIFKDKTGNEQIVDDLKSANEVPGQDYTVHNELSNAQQIIIKQRNRIIALEKGITRTDLEKMIENNKCRKKNGNINYSALGKILGCSNHTAKSRCKYFGVT